MEKYQSMLRQAEDKMNQFCDMTEMLRQKFEHMTLDRELLEYLVEKVIVYEDQRVEVRVRCNDVFEAVATMLEGGDPK